VRYGRPLRPAEGEGARAFRTRMMKAVAQLAAEEELGWYQALRASADGAIDLPGSRNGEVARWRRVWESTRPPSPNRRRVWR
jgi:1-acyl-sn-glycerol-3-phosphate acyltransferase